MSRQTELRRLPLLCAIVAVCAVSLYAGSPKPYRVGYGHFPPYMMQNPDGSPGGFAVEMVAEAARRSGIPIEWVQLPRGVSRVPEVELGAGTIDMYPLFGYTPGRRKEFHLTEPWWENSVALFADQRKGFRSPEDLQGKQVSVQGSSFSAELAEQFLPKSHFLFKTTYEDILRPVCTGEADAAFLATRLFEELLQNRVSGCESVPFQPIFVPESTILYSVGSSKQAAGAAERIAGEIGSMAYDGAMAKIGARNGILVTKEARMFQRLLVTRRQTQALLVLVGFLAGVIFFVVWQNYRVRQARKAAERARQAEAEFLAHMSHEIRTPMNGVLGMLELALETPMTAEQRDYLETANHSALGLLSVLNDILDFSKIDAGRLELERIEFSPRQVVEECEKTLSPQAHKKLLSVTCMVAPSVPGVCKGDPGRLRQVLLNLFGNAIKFTDRGSVRIDVDLESDQTTEVILHFRVTDTGIGIEPADRQKIFQAFSQADRSTTRKFGGTGLGLTISARLVELMHGNIWVDSEPGRGSTFHFTAALGKVRTAEDGSRLSRSVRVGE